MENIFDYPEFTRAVVREVPSTVNNAIRDEDSNEKIDLAKCKKEWETYVQILKDLHLDVTVLPADNSLPDCLFVEDACVVIGKTALITRPADLARRGETTALEECMTNLGLNVTVVESTTATLEGGDVLFTGKELFCGESQKTNPEGFSILEETFPNYSCHPIFVEWPEFHLLGYIGYAAPGVISVCENDWGVIGWDDISEVAHYTYKPLWLPDDFANNCIFINGTILHCTEKQKPNSYNVYVKEMAEYNLIPVSTEEVAKVDAALTCQSLLF